MARQGRGERRAASSPDALPGLFGIPSALVSAGGRVYQDQGESFLFVFQRAKDAVLAAASAQRTLSKHSWPEGTPLRVRMGLHSGEPAASGEEYVGIFWQWVSLNGSSGRGRSRWMLYGRGTVIPPFKIHVRMVLVAPLLAR